MHGRRLRYPRGKLLGGCSSISVDQAWGWQQVLPDFIAHECHHLGRSEFHGADGQWRVGRQRLHWPVHDAVREAALQLGRLARDDFNQGDKEGVAYFELNQRGGWRWNAAQAFLRPARKRIQLHTGARVDSRRCCCSVPDSDPPPCCGSSASACVTTCAASAPICRTICNCARPGRCGRWRP
ncbi:MAG: hypothetical protein ACK4F7_02180 [Inhella sp.]